MGRSRWTYIAGGALLLLAVVFGGIEWSRRQVSEPSPPVPPAVSELTTSDVPEESKPPYVSPIDFAALQEQNPDIRAWLSMPGVEQEGPVVCREDDDSYYLRRDSNGKYAVAGSYFIENYNAFDFSDPVTVIYGHNISDGSMFGALQETYSNGEKFSEGHTFTIYTPDAEYEYHIFAAVPYGNRHLLYYHNFHSFPILQRFLEEIYETRSLIANVEHVEIAEGDRIVVLSTCQDGNKTQRYLVMGHWKNSDK